MKQVKQPLTIALRKQNDDGTTQISLGFFLLIFSLCFFSFTPLKQASQKQDSHQRNKIDAWIFDKVVDNVECYHMIAECSGKKAVFLKFNNKNNYKVKISWKEIFKEKGSEEKIENFKNTKQLVLSPGIKTVSSCSDPQNKELVITHDQVSMTHSVNIAKFEFDDVQVNPLH